MRSDAYTITFTTIITVILGLGLSATADSLRDRQILNEELDIKKNILSVLGYKQNIPWTNEEVQSLYDSNINEIKIDEVGSVLDEVDKSGNFTYTGFNIVGAKNYEKDNMGNSTTGTGFFTLNVNFTFF